MWANSSGYLLPRITVGLEGSIQMVEFGLKKIGFTNTMGPMSEGFQNSAFLTRMMIGILMQIPIRMSRLPIYGMTKATIGFSGDKNV